MKEKKDITEMEALQRLSTLCAQSEHCSWEMVEKMRRWGLTEEAQARVIERLVEEHYVDDTRYCRSFIHDKVRYNKWGRRKVEQALKAKRIDSDTYRPILDEVDDEEYLQVLRPLLQAKRRQLKAMSEYEANGRLIRFALGKGFTFDIIKQCLDTEGHEMEEDDGGD
ncbi:MAG: RecX family transcriptional regulator [Prevotella sp.]|nr:RecX family transcriptional regulator [Prevotella sp.]